MNRFSPSITITDAVISCMKIIPLRIRRFLGFVTGTCLSYVLSREKEITLLQLKKFLPEFASENNIKKIFIHFATAFFENINTKPVLKTSPFKLISKTGVTIEKLKKLPTGALTLTGHFGNWDLLGGFYANYDIEVFTVGRKARSKISQFILEKIRKENRITTLWRESDRNMREIMSIMKQNKFLAVLIDQDTNVRSDFIDFFGTPAKTPSGLIELALRFHLPVYTTFLAVEKDDKGNNCGYTVHIEEMPTNLSEKELLLLYHQQLEDLIRQYPEQWVWFHKRWRTLPNNFTHSRKEYISWLKSAGKICFYLPLIVFTSILINGCSLLAPAESMARKAQIESENGNTDTAIKLYRSHIQDRLDNDSRPEWENPYFYHLIIGDLELSRQNFEQALIEYKLAKENSVENSLFLDRIRIVASKYEELGEYEKAIDTLTPYINEDPFLMNEMLDRLSKKLLK